MCTSLQWTYWRKQSYWHLMSDYAAITVSHLSFHYPRDWISLLLAAYSHYLHAVQQKLWVVSTHQKKGFSIVCPRSPSAWRRLNGGFIKGSVEHNGQAFFHSRNTQSAHHNGTVIPRRPTDRQRLPCWRHQDRRGTGKARRRARNCFLNVWHPRGA